MLVIRVNGKIIDLADHVNIQLNLKNPMFHDVGAHTLSFSVPDSQNNKSIFDFPNRVEKYYGKKEFPCEFEFYPLRMLGSAVISETEENSYTCYLKLDEGSFFSKAKNTKLNEINYGDDVFLGADKYAVAETAKSFLTKSYPEVNFNFPMIYAPDFYENNSGWSEVVNSWDSANQVFAKNSNQSSAYFCKYNLSPQMYLFFILKKICENFNLNAVGELFDNSDLSKLLLLNTCALDNKIKKYFSRATCYYEQVIYHGGSTVLHFTDKYNTPDEDYDDCFDLTTNRYYFKAPGLHTVKIKLTASYTNWTQQSTILVAVNSSNPALNESDMYFHHPPDPMPIDFSYTFTVSQADVDNNAFIVFSCFSQDGANVTIAMDASVMIINHEYLNVNVFSNSIKYKNHFSDAECSKLIKDLNDFIGIRQFIKGQNVEFKFLKSIINDQSFIDISSFCKKPKRITDTSKIQRLKNKSRSDTDIEYYNFIGAFNSKNLLPTNQPLNSIALLEPINMLLIPEQDINTFDQSWINYIENYFDFIIDKNAETIIDTNCGPIKMRHQYDDYANGSVMPFVSGKGKSLPYNQSGTNSDFTLFFYIGMKPNKNNQNYPFATSLNKDMNGNIVNQYSLLWDGAYGLYEKLWKDYIYWYNNVREPFEAEAYLSPVALADLDYSKKIMIGNCKFFVSEIKVNISNTRIGKSTLSLLKC